MRSRVDREHLLQQISSRPVGHHRAEMRLQPVQLRCRPAMQWPANASLDPATRGTAKPGKPHCDLAEQRRHRMVPVVLQTPNPATARTTRPPNGVLPGLRGDDLPLNARQQPLRFGQGQTQVGDVAEIIGPSDFHDVRARLLALNPDLHQPRHPGHASTLGQRTGAKISNWPSHPQSCDGPRTGTTWRRPSDRRPRSSRYNARCVSQTVRWKRPRAQRQRSSGRHDSRWAARRRSWSGRRTACGLFGNWWRCSWRAWSSS